MRQLLVDLRDMFDSHRDVIAKLCLLRKVHCDRVLPRVDAQDRWRPSREELFVANHLFRSHRRGHDHELQRRQPARELRIRPELNDTWQQPQK